MLGAKIAHQEESFIVRSTFATVRVSLRAKNAGINTPGASVYGLAQADAI